jgi:hypothetical protein
MSEKKPIVEEDVADDDSGIEIVTVGVKNSSAEIKHKDPAVSVLPPPQEQDEEAVIDDEPAPSHTHLGEKKDEQKIREHVSDVLHEIEGDESDESE